MIIKTKNLNKYFTCGRQRLHILKDINVAFPRGQIAAIVGPSGAGKSTLLHALGGLDRDILGDVLFEGEPIEKFPEAKMSAFRNNAVGFIFQFYHLLPEFNALENVMLPALINVKAKVKRPYIKEKAKELLCSLGLADRLKHAPGQLSGGQQQRVAIARALINGPEILLCDEPTGNLDSENGRQISSLLASINKKEGTTIIIVTHNLDMASIASKVYNIQDGVLRES